MKEVYQDLYQFADDIPAAQSSLQQYLLLTEEPVLIHTGTMRQAETILPRIKELLDGRALKYILVSHFETEECGGLLHFQIAFPEVITVCSEKEAWQLYNLGYTSPVIAKKSGETLSGNDFEFSFFDYPSGTDRPDGILFMENKRGIVFTSDLLLQEKHAKLKSELLKNSPAFIAAGKIICQK
jgi:flavorubredoxin